MSHEDAKARGTAAPLSWNAGAWFGAQVGATCWMLIASGLLLSPSEDLAFALLALFIAANGIGWVVWSRRSYGMPALTGYRLLVVWLGLYNLAGLYAIETTGNWSRIEVGGSLPPAIAMAFVAVMTCVLWFLIGRRARGATGVD